MTALVAQLMREQRSAEDKAIFDAYQNGGLYKGKPVTDGRILEHMKGRRDGFSKDDPLWDQWNNQFIQQKFSIGEQKIGLAFQQGKVGAGAVAAFYRKSLSGIPKDSAFYRDVAGRAAQWAKSAAGAARGRARGRATSGLRQKLNKQLETQQTYLGLEAALTAYAKREGLISGTQKLTDADATELQAMFDRGIYSGTDRITFDDFSSAAKDHYSALGAEIDTRLSLGQQAVEARSKRSRFLGETLVRLNAVDERSQYELAREDWLSNVAAAGNDPYAVAAANEKYTAALTDIHKNASAGGSGVNANDPEFIGGLANEYELMTTGKVSGKTVYDLYDMVDVGGNSKQQAEFQAALDADIKLLDSGAAYYGQTEPGGELGVVKWPTGLGTNPLGLDDSLQPSVSTINGQKRLTYLKGESVSASVLLDENDQVVDAATITAGDLRAGLSAGTLRVESGGNVGYVFTNPESGKIKYGVTDPVNGTMMFTDENPWSSATVQVAGVGTTVFSTLAREDEKGNFLPDISGVMGRPVNIETADPLLSDGPVSTKDLMTLIDSGTTGVSLSEEQLQKYQMRLQKQERDRLLNMQTRGPGGIGNLGAGLLGNSDVTRGGGGDLRSNILEGMNSVRQVTQELFARTPRDGSDLGAPPPLAAPKVEAPWQGLKPDGTPKDVVELTPGMPDRYEPEPDVRNYSPHQPSQQTPKLTPKPGETVFVGGKKFIV